MVRCAGFEDVREHGRFRHAPARLARLGRARRRPCPGAGGGRRVSRGLRRLRGPVQAAAIWANYRGGPRLMSRLRKWWVMARNPQVRFEISEPVHFGPGFGIHAPYGGTLRVGQAVEFRRGFRIELAEGYSEVSIGAGVGVHLRRRDPVRPANRDRRALHLRPGDDDRRRRPPLPRPRAADRPAGLRPAADRDRRRRLDRRQVPPSSPAIGAGTVVGANSVVTRDLPANVVAVGAPGPGDRLLRPPGAEPARRLPGGEEVRRQLLTVVEVGAAPGARADQRRRAASRSGSGAGRARRRAAGARRG